MVSNASEIAATRRSDGETNAPDVVIVIVSYNGGTDLLECLESLAADRGETPRTEIVIVDNGSTDGSPEQIKSEWPQVTLLRSEGNLGFAGGNNFGWKYASAEWPGARFLCLLNQDTLVRAGWLKTLTTYLEAHPDVDIVQPKLLLHPETNRINTAGNRCQYLGFTYMTAYGEVDDGRFEEPVSIDVASGAALVVRSETVRQVGLFDETMFMYLEDTELSWKVRLLGRDVMFVPTAIVEHRYTASAPYTHYEHLERNRWMLLLKYYKWQTLLLIAPALAAMECGQWLFAARYGLIAAKWQSYRTLWQREIRRRIARDRAEMTRMRTVGDRAFLGQFAGTIHFSAITSPLLTWIGNPLLGAWWCAVRRLIFW